MKIICIGMNYTEHVRELADVTGREIPIEPIFFLKPDTALLQNNRPFYLPEFSSELHYECELVVRIAKPGKAIDEKFACRYYNEVGLGIDFTARDLQRQCKAKGMPWEMAKAFDHSAAIGSEFLSLDSLGKSIQELQFSLQVNGEQRQRGHTADMIFSVDRIIAYVSRFITLKIGDLIFTGTPAGVGPVQIGDRLEGVLEGQKLLNFNIK